jgi:hypothetical protein
MAAEGIGVIIWCLARDLDLATMYRDELRPFIDTDITVRYIDMQNAPRVQSYASSQFTRCHQVVILSPASNLWLSTNGSSAAQACNEAIEHLFYTFPHRRPIPAAKRRSSRLSAGPSACHVSLRRTGSCAR